jgi:hypothetical protein
LRINWLVINRGLVAPPEAALSWILVLTMSIGWMQIVAKQPDADPIKKGLQADRIGLSNLTSKEGSAKEAMDTRKEIAPIKR